MDVPKTVNCIEKALEIPVVQSMKDNVGHFYATVKLNNRISKFGLDTIESGVTLFYHGLNSIGVPLQKPIELVDSVACVVLDEVKEKYPGILEPTETVIASSKTAILRTNVAQKTLNGVDTMLGAAEALVTMFPSVRVKEDGDDVKESDHTLIIKALKPITVCYSLATWPLRYTAGVLHERRTRIRTLSRTLYSDDDSDQEVEHREVVVSSRKQMENIGIVECIFFIPRFLLRTIGKLASERSQRLFIAESLLADQTPNKADVSTEEKKRKYDCIDSDEFDDEASLNDLNETLGDETDPDDDDFEPDYTVGSDSMEYNSGSVVEENDEFNETNAHDEHNNETFVEDSDSTDESEHNESKKVDEH